MSAVKYSFLKFWWGFAAQPASGVEIEVPVIAHELYERLGVPDGTTIIVNEGSSSGYDLLDSVFNPICSFLEFNPFKLGKFNINQRGIDYNNGMIPTVINAFMGEHLEPTSKNGHYLYPDNTGYDVSTAFYADGSSTSQAGLGATRYSGRIPPFANVIEPYQRDSSEYNGVTYTFEIWRPEVIESGYINTQRFQTDNGLIRIGRVMINIWTLNDKWYYDIRLLSLDYSQSETDTIIAAFNQEELPKIYDPANPFDNKQANGDEGGGASSDDGSDPVDIPDLPTLDVSDLGGINLYRVTAGDVRALLAYLNSATPGDNILKWFTNPIQAIVSLHVVPYPVEVVGSDAIKVLGLSAIGTAGYKIKQFQEWDLGGVRVPYGFDNTFLDYEPFTKVAIYLPFVGIRQLDTDEVMGQSLNVTYQFDNVSGSCIAFVTVNGAVRYTFSGSCAIGIPISQSNWGQTYMAAATIAAGGISGAVGAGAAAMGSATSMGAVAGQAALGAGQGIATASGLGSAIGKPSVSRSGSISGAASALGVPYPYLIIERPVKASSANPAPVTGLISGRTLPLASLSGYNIIESVHLSGVPATASELDEIERLLYQGVVF